MSADRGRSSSTSSLRSEAPKGCIIRPQPVTESSLLDSVAGFINDVQALNKPNHDSKIQITWASFQKADVNDPALFPEAVEINGKWNFFSWNPFHVKFFVKIDFTEKIWSLIFSGNQM